MKRLSLFFMMALAIAFYGCTGTQNGQNGQEEQGTVDLSNSAMVILDHGQIQFYDYLTQQLTPYTLETDSVVNAVYTSDNVLYYTVSTKDGLVLNRLNLNQENPKPEHFADWNLTADQCFDDVTNMTTSLMLSDDEQCIGMFKDFSWETEFYGFTGMAICNLVEGKVYDMEEIDYGYEHFYEEMLFDSFGSDGRDFYYFDSSDHYCLTDKLGLMDYLEIQDEEELEEIDYSALSFSPDGKKILFSAVLPWGDFGYGPYCVSTSDGSQQWILEGSEFHDDRPQWLPDGSLVFKGSEQLMEEDPEYEEYWKGQKPCICIMSPEGEMSILSYAITFAAQPMGAEDVIAANNP